MKHKILCCIVSVVLALCVAVPAMAASVAQGKCVSYDADKQVLVIDEFDIKFTPEHKYGQPTGKQLTFSTKDALVGITPQPGDICRIAYEAKDKENKAIRVMNVTKQDVMKR
jgi:hypothetical protein